MRVLLENTTFPLHKVIKIAGIIRVAGNIRGRALYVGGNMVLRQGDGMGIYEEWVQNL